MKWSSALSSNASLSDAIAECVVDLREDLGEVTPDLAIAFVSAHHTGGFEAVPELVRQRLGDCPLIGCTGGGVIGAGREIEGYPGFAMAGAVLPDVDVVPFHLENEDLPDADSAPARWEELVKATSADQPEFILVTDPFSFASDRLVMGLDYAFPRSAKIGGLASGGHLPGGNALYLSDCVYRSGAVGVALTGAVTIDTVVAQGCRPIGDQMQITSCAQNWLLEVDGCGVMDALRGVVAGLSERDQQLVRRSLFLGIAMDRLNESPEMGDFLVRNIVGGDQARGALAIGEMLQEGQIVQFHLRDAETSAQDLDALLTRYAVEHPTYEETGALLFSCLGRGMGLYGRADHDTDMFREKVSAMPLTGFFCNGEIGPVGGTTFLHGYTSSFGIFRTRHRD